MSSVALSGANSSGELARKKKVVYYYDEEVGNFYYGLYHPMKPARLRMVHELVVAYGLFKKMSVFRPYRLDERELTKFHSDDYVHFLKQVTLENKDSWGLDLERFNIDIDCPIFDGLYRFCQVSCGGSVGGAYKLNHSMADIAINWTGGLHHAKKSEASGFCYLNDIVLGILELLKYHSRVLYVDIDIHHGDGVEEAFYTTDRVMTVSFHKYGDFFPGTGAISDTGVKQGRNYSVNVPLDEGIDDESFGYIFRPVISEVMRRFQPTAVVTQLGADSLAGDKLGCFNLTVRGHGDSLDYLRSFNLPMLVLGGGGYTLRNVARCWTHETGICCGLELEDRLPYNDYYEYFAPTYTLSTTPTNIVNCNTRASLDQSRQSVCEHLRSIAAVPSVEMKERSKDASIDHCTLDSIRSDIDQDYHSDTRITHAMKDRLVDYRNDFYSGDQDQDTSNTNNDTSHKEIVTVLVDSLISSKDNDNNHENDNNNSDVPMKTETDDSK